MTYALMSGGGKNSVLALDRARRDQMDVGFMATVYVDHPESARFHGTPRALIEQQARCLGLEPIAIRADEHGFDEAFEDGLSRLRSRGVDGIVFGDVSLESVRTWYEERVTDAGLEHVAPNWGSPSIEVAWEVVERGYQAVVVSVHRAHKAMKYLGREFDSDMVAEIGCTDGLDPCGERGEYHTFVFDGPAFERPVEISLGDLWEFEQHSMIKLIQTKTASL